MAPNGACDDATESNRYSVANLARYNFVVERLSRFHESVGLGKCLQHCSFPERNCTILIGMPESAISDSRAMRGEGGGQIVPNHPAINGTICFARRFLVAFQPQVVTPISPATTLRCRFQAFQIYGGQRPATVQPVLRMPFASAQRRHPANPTAHCSISRLRVCLPQKIYFSEFGRNKNQTATALRNPIVRAENDGVGDFETSGLKRRDEAAKCLVLGEFGDVLHRNNIG